MPEPEVTSCGEDSVGQVVLLVPHSQSWIPWSLQHLQLVVFRTLTEWNGLFGFSVGFFEDKGYNFGWGRIVELFCLVTRFFLVTFFFVAK